MRLIDADAFDTILENGEIEAKKQRKYVLVSALNTVRGNLAKQPSVSSSNCSEIPNNWIPCSERLPEEAGGYLCTCTDARRLLVTLIKWQPKMKSWNLSGARAYWKVIAWMPLPEPYNERRTDDKRRSSKLDN